MSNSTPGADTEKKDLVIVRNAILEGLWALVTFAIGAGATQLQLEPFQWVYGAVAAFSVGCVGYLVKAYKLGSKS